jgi:hypothetical protein
MNMLLQASALSTLILQTKRNSKAKKSVSNDFTVSAYTMFIILQARRTFRVVTLLASERVQDWYTFIAPVSRAAWTTVRVWVSAIDASR